MSPVRPVGPGLDRHDGFTLIEVLVGMLVVVIVVGATLTLMEGIARGLENNQRRNDTQQQSRTTLDRMARALRNLASPTSGRPEAVDKAAPYDLVFQTVDPIGPNAGVNAANVRRVRYCLDGGDPSSGVIWMQVQTWTQSATAAVPSTASCPDSDPRWVSRQVVASDVVNRIGGQNRPIWTFDATMTTEIAFIRTTLHIDRSPGHAPGETTLSTGVFLRNQNRLPIAAFTATITGGRHVLLNGSPSSDPEGLPLTYAWYDGGIQVGSGVTYDYLAPAAGPRSLSLAVTDPGGLAADAAVQTVTVQ